MFQARPFILGSRSEQGAILRQVSSSSEHCRRTMESPPSALGDETLKIFHAILIQESMRPLSKLQFIHWENGRHSSIRCIALFISQTVEDISLGFRKSENWEQTASLNSIQTLFPKVEYLRLFTRGEEYASYLKELLASLRLGSFCLRDLLLCGHIPIGSSALGALSFTNAEKVRLLFKR